MKLKRTRTAAHLLKNGIFIAGMWIVLGPPFIYSVWRYHKSYHSNQKKKG